MHLSILGFEATSAMAIPLQVVHSFLVRPAKGFDPQPEISGTDVVQGNKLFAMLSNIFATSEAECSHDIAFDSAPDGTQKNPRRNQILEYLRNPTTGAGRELALELQKVTTNHSGLGLLFLLSGVSGKERTLVISRFPADSAIMADEGKTGLTVQFLEKVFMKSATSYKAAVYTGTSLDGDFWDGRAVDKQANDDLRAISHYWINDFLLSDFRATSAQGTRRLADVLVKATKAAPDVSVKKELIAVAQMARGLSGKAVSIASMCKRFALSDVATRVVMSQCPNREIQTEQFRFDLDEFEKRVTIQMVTLDTGAIVMAPADEFSQLIRREPVRGSDGKVRLVTEGTVVDESLKRSRVR